MKSKKQMKRTLPTELEVREAVQKFIQDGGRIRMLRPEKIPPRPPIWPECVNSSQGRIQPKPVE